MRRGEIWWATLPDFGHQPVILVTRDPAITVRSLVTVVPLTRRARGIPVEVPLDPGDGVPRACVANADTVATVSKSLLTRRIGRLAPRKLRELEDALRFALGL